MGSDSTLAERLDEVFGAALRERRVVGAVAIVARDGQVKYRRAHGLADREGSVPMREDTLFRLASVTKPIVTMAVLRLVGDELIRLDDPVTRWLPDFRPSLADGTTPDLTIHHLLTHTAGLSYGLLEEPESPFHALGISDGIDVVDFDLRENLRRLAAAPLQFPPGSAWRYSLALDVLGAVVENATGLTLDRAVEKLAASPLGMRESGFVAGDLTRFAVPYANGEPEPFRIAENASVPLPQGIGVAVRFGPSRVVRPDAYPSGGAGMYGPADDVLLLLEAIRAGDGFLTDGLRTLMRTDHVGPQAQTRGPGWGFGYGGAVLADPAAADSPQGAGTIGWGGVYGHSWFVDAVHGLSVLLLTNTAYEGMTGALTVEVRDAVYAAA
ncbi:serine hydrolase domain-containing protein [Mycobacteroides abscessus]|uniref:Beta-lactamase n=2 Tax=Mycobacteroides abscessus TaxID=36809 RepID=A0A829HX54_9MYCO|nr:serine hydrolase domain-containing protein [Mycobacteroides abscessus]ESV60000.1 esterase estB [Mycobacteroides abscessus MAB_082312_2258]ESV63293.1 esterase estB [Mycobacteroides abscessus MAB_091912_2446]AIC72299.1 beta-lactamase [Mycobacteroides abscessus subsp. massiliense str. GO 06]AWG54698.1 serine hydrolase [Mycobacteroides abscessus]AWG59527.1 serine hydrolase [Mycobacteroides abscessus]